jgi:hypothetical protein
MTRRTKIALAVAGTVAFLACLAGIVVANVAFDSQRTETFTVSQPITKVIVSADSGDVRIVATDSDRVAVRQTTHWLRQAPKPERTVADGVLRLDEGCHHLFIFRCETDFRIEVPRDFAGPVKVRSDSGDVDLAFAIAPSQVDARSDSGDVRVEVPRAEYALEADTDSGDTSVSGILAYDAALHSLEARSDSGDVTVVGR